MRNDTRVSWSPIFAGVLAATGMLLCFAFLGRSIGANGPVAAPPLGALPYPSSAFEPDFGGVVFALIANFVSFGLAAYAVVALGAFATARASVLHAAAGFFATVLVIHFSGRSSLFVGRPGLPLAWVSPAGSQFLSPAYSWLIFASALVGGIGCCAVAYLAWLNSARDVSANLGYDEAARDLAA